MSAEKENETPPKTSMLETSQQQMGCGILGRYPIISILVFAAVGIICGVGLSFWIPKSESEQSGKDATLQWLGLIGDLFIRLLTCFVLPLVFVTVVISVVDMMNAGKASAIGYRVICFYIFTTLMASIWGIIAALAFTPLYQTSELGMTEKQASVTFQCSNGFLAEMDDGSVSCTSDYKNSSDITFVMNDVNSYFLVDTEGQPQSDLSLSDTLYDGVFMKLFTNNIFFSFAEGNFAAVVIFSMIFGAALGVEMSNAHLPGGRKMEPSLNVLADMDKVFVRMLTWIISGTPFAVWSLITAAVGAQQDLKTMFSNVGLLMVTIAFGYILQYLSVYVLGYWFFYKIEPD